MPFKPGQSGNPKGRSKNLQDKELPSLQAELTEKPKSPVVQAVRVAIGSHPEASPINGVIPPPQYRWPPGQSGNPGGSRTAGAYIREWVNSLVVSDVPEDELRRIASDRKESPARRGAAVRVIRYMERGDLADFQWFLDGTSDLKHLRENGIYTDIVKKVKSKKRTIPGPEGSPPTIELEREIELHDRSGEDFDRICDRTDGKPTQRVELDANVSIPHIVRVITPLTAPELPPAAEDNDGG